jgi:hypothetical protein
MMIEQSAGTQTRTVARLAETRRQLLELFLPERNADGTSAPGPDDAFPRSRTLRLLLGRHGLGAVSALAGGLLIARPALLWRLLRWAPVRAIAKTLLVRLLATTGSKP